MSNFYFLIPCNKIEDIIWLRGDRKFLFECGKYLKAMEGAIYYVAISSGDLFAREDNMLSRERSSGISLVFI